MMEESLWLSLVVIDDKEVVFGDSNMDVGKSVGKVNLNKLHILCLLS